MTRVRTAEGAEGVIIELDGRLAPSQRDPWVPEPDPPTQRIDSEVTPVTNRTTTYASAASAWLAVTVVTGVCWGGNSVQAHGWGSMSLRNDTQGTEISANGIVFPYSKDVRAVGANHFTVYYMHPEGGASRFYVVGYEAFLI